MTELWVSINEYPGYEVSSFGRVRSLDRITYHGGYRPRRLSGKLLKNIITKSSPYPTVCLCNEQGARKVRVHELVAKHFLSARPSPKHEVNHCNGIKSDCRKDNLEWTTSACNTQHAYSNGLNPRANGLTNELILEIRRELSKAKEQKPSLYGEVKRLAKKYNLPIYTVSKINKGRIGGYI